MNHRIRTVLFAALLPLAVAQVSVAQAPTPGERWRTTMSMEAMGMKMPGQTMEVCSPKTPNNAPPVGNDECQATNMRQKGNTLSYDMACKDGTTGSMEMTQDGPNKWTGRMTANRPEGQMTMVMKSEKLPGECDASAMERKMNQMIAQGNAQQAEACLQGARSGSAAMFLGSSPACKDKASVDAYCAYAKSSKGYNGLSRQQRMANGGAAIAISPTYRTAIADTGKLCGFAPDTVRKQLCGSAQSKKDWTFFAEECPESADPIGKRECVGRDFTTPVSPPYVEFCSAWSSAKRGQYSGSSRGSDDAADGSGDSGGGKGNSGRAGQQGGDAGAGNGNANGNGQNGEPDQADKPKPTDAAKEALKKGKDALRGLFGR